MTDEEKRKASEELIYEMKDAVEKDNEANSKRKQAIRKLMSLETVTRDLRRIPIQEHFIDAGGLHALADWLYPLPDGTFPNIRIVEEIL